jgi:hypothetical protein
MQSWRKRTQLSVSIASLGAKVAHHFLLGSLANAFQPVTHWSLVSCKQQYEGKSQASCFYFSLARLAIVLKVTMASTQTETPWYAAYPVAKSNPPAVLRAELLQWFKDGKQTGKDFVLVDLRRTDFEV